LAATTIHELQQGGGMEDVHTATAADVATAQLLAELSVGEEGLATCRLLANGPLQAEATPCAWIAEEQTSGASWTGSNSSSSTSNSNSNMSNSSNSSNSSNAAQATAAAAAVPATSLQLPSLADLSADHLSLNYAYFPSHPMPSPSPFLPFAFCGPYAPQPQLLVPLTPAPATYNPLTTMSVCDTWYVRWADCTSKRGRINRATLSFQWQSRRADAVAASDTLQLPVKLYSHKGLLNRNAHYRRGRFGCVLLSAHQAIVVTAFRASAHSEMVMLREQPSSHDPLFALALGTCYEIRFFSSAADAVDVHHIAARSTVDVTVSRSPVQPHQQSSPASAAAALPSATLTSSPSMSSAASTASMDTSSIPSTPMSTRPSCSNLPSRTRVSCVSCRQAKAKCDEQR
jgi:hypothetical protein